MTGILNKLFGRHEKSFIPEIPTDPLNEEQQPEPFPVDQRTHLEPPQLLTGCAQSVGKQRDHNEDALFILTTNLASDKTHSSFGLYIVADGMGGHRNGEIASSIAVRSLANHVVRKLYTSLLSPQPASPSQPLQEILLAAIQEAQQTILKEVPGGGTTLTAAILLGEQVTIAHVGDSRAYLVSPSGDMQVLTRDHTLVKRLVELGQITTEEAAIHPQRNVLYRALGQGEPVEPDISTSPMAHSSYLLLCSDGLWGVVPEKELARIILAAPNLEQACHRMVEAANAAGGPDNITAVLVRMPD